MCALCLAAILENGSHFEFRANFEWLAFFPETIHPNQHFCHILCLYHQLNDFWLFYKMSVLFKVAILNNGRHFEFRANIEWLAFFPETIHPNQHFCQLSCLYHQLNESLSVLHNVCIIFGGHFGKWPPF